MKSFVRSFIPALLVFLQVHFCFAQMAVILPPGETTFFDANGNPLTSGTVDFYNPGTTNRATTWQDANETIPNTNPVILDAAGRAIIWGQGTYRQVVKDRLGNQIWDQITSSGAGSGGATNFGDGNAVGTIKAWAGIVAPAQYLFAYGQQISRTTYANLLSAITLITNVTCTSGSSTLSSISDTSSIPVGSVVEVSCIPGSAIVNSVTSSTVNVSAPANISTSVNATFFPFGNGNGSSTFTLPDLRGYVIAGRDNMGGTAAGRLTSTYFGATPDALGAVGGSQNQTLTVAQIASHTHNVQITDPGHLHDIIYAFGTFTTGGAQAVNSLVGGGQTADTQSATTGITATNTYTGGGVATSASLNTTSGIAVSSSISAAGSGYTNGSTRWLTINGGTCSTQPQINVTIAGNAVTQLNSIRTAGTCTVAPTNPAATTISSGGGSGATINVAFVGTSAVLATIPNSGTGSGYTNGVQTLTTVGGTCTTQPTINVLVASNSLAAVSSIATAGVCTVFPSNPVATTGGGGTGGTINVTWNDGGSGWTEGARVLTVTGGTCTSQPRFNATILNGAVNSIGALQQAGSCSITPSNPATLSDAGGVGASATLSNGGSGYTNGAQVLTLSGGTCSVQPSFNVTVSGNTVTSVNSVASAGACTVVPTNPVATTGGGGIGATLNVTYTIGGTGAFANVIYSGQPVTTIQPTITLNYVIKVLPDISLSTSNVVTSINGQTGIFTCGANMTCSGNVISSTGGGGSGDLTVGTTVIMSGNNSRVLFDNSGILGEYTITGTGSVALNTSPTFITPILGVAAATSINGLILSMTTGGTLTLQNNVTFDAGANNLTFTTSGATNITLPTSGTMVTTAVTTLSSLANVGTLVSGATGAGFTLALGTSTLTGQVPVVNGGTGLSSGTSGGVLAFTASGVIASSGALTANLPVIGGGAGIAPTVGTRSGNTTKFVTTTGTLTASDCVSIDGSGNFIAAGGPCTTGGGGGTVAAATIGELAIYTGTTTVGGLATCNNGYVGTNGSGINSCNTSVNTTLSATITALGTIATGVWNGTVIPLAYGGTNNNITADNGAIPYSDGSKIVLLASTASAGLCLISGSSSAPSWGSCSGLTVGSTAVSSGTNTRVLYDNAGILGEYAIIGTGNVVMSTSPTITTPTFSGTVTGPAGTWSTSGLSVTGGGTGITSGTSGGVLYFNSTTSIASSALLTANNPVLGGGAGTAPFTGTRSGNTTVFGTTSGSLTSGNCIKSDGSGNLVDNGSSCNAGAAVLLNTLTASSSASLSDTTSFTSTYKFYDLVFLNILPATNVTRCELQVQYNSTFQTSGYITAVLANGSLDTGVTANIPCSSSTNNILNSNSGVNGVINVYNPSAIGLSTMFSGQMAVAITGPSAQIVNISGQFNSSAFAVTGFKVLMASGNIASGTIYVYGRN